jgi:hypothetical protein
MGMAVTARRNLELEVSDVSGQKPLKVSNVVPDATIGELIQSVLGQMDLPPNDVDGRPLTYHARLDREGRHLHATETVGDVLTQGDHLVLQPNIDAGLAS